RRGRIAGAKPPGAARVVEGRRLVEIAATAAVRDGRFARGRSERQAGERASGAGRQRAESPREARAQLDIALRLEPAGRASTHGLDELTGHVARDGGV